MSGRMRGHPTSLKARRLLIMGEKRGMRGNWREAFQDLLQDASELGVALRGFRIREGWTQSELAEKLGIDQSNVSKMERGVRPIGKSMAKRLAAIFKTDYRNFL